MTFQNGDQITIPANVAVRSTHPSHKRYSTKRKQIVTIHHTLPATTCFVIDMQARVRHSYPQHQAAFDRFDELMLDADTNPDHDKRRRLYREAREIRIELAPAEVSWVGQGGYWCRVAVTSLN